MDRSQQRLSAIDELRQIRKAVRLTESMDSVRKAFDRIQELRREFVDEFDLQITIADAQQEIIERARAIREAAAVKIAGGNPVAIKNEAEADRSSVSYTDRRASVVESSVLPVPTRVERRRALDDESAAEIPPDVPRINKKSWQVAMGLAAVFTIAICSVIFYLIQTARRINFEPDPSVTVTGPQKPVREVPVSAEPLPTTPLVPLTPTLRLYTDLIPGTVSFDDQPEQTLVDGEFNLENVKPGNHSVKVAGQSGSASFSFSVADDKHAPSVSGLPVGNNAMVVLVSVENGTGHLVTDDYGAEVSLDEVDPDGKAGTKGRLIGVTPSTGFDGLEVPDLGNVDHDLEVSQAKNKQRFVLTYSPAPTLTVFVKSDPSTGMLTVLTGQDDVNVYINDTLYKRPTERGKLRVPLKVGTYRIRIHKVGFVDPPAAKVEVKKAEEASVQFRLQPAPDFASLQIQGAQPGTSLYIDGKMAATIEMEGTAKVVNIKSGDHVIELRHDQAVTKQLTRTFTAGNILTLTGADVMLDRIAADNKTVIPANPGPAPLGPPIVPQLQQPQRPQDISSNAEVVHKGGGFVPYNTPQTAGHYYFQAHTRLGGILKRGKLQWYAAYHDPENYVLFTLDGKHASVREVREGKSVDLSKVAFDVNTDEWIQVDVSLQPNVIQTRVKTSDKGWSALQPVASSGEDFTKEGVGLYVPSNDEVAVANFRFTGR